MKVYIGKYPRYLSAYKWIDWSEKYIGERVSDKITDMVQPTLNFIYNNRFYNKRKIKVRIDHHDIWGMDHTLALIIVPMLKLLKEKKQGSPYIDDEDVPEELKSTSAPPKKNEYDIDDNHHKRWEWVINEEIWAFEQILVEDSDDYNFELDKKRDDRISRGFKLFGKYFRCHWD